MLPLYPEVNRDLVIMGVFLHDSGKVRELSYARTFAYSDEGQLLGHLTIGIEMLADKARKVPDLTGEPFPAELLLRLKHLILSHHGETGVRQPEGADDAGGGGPARDRPARLADHHRLREIADDRGESAWTPYNAALGRRLYKGGRSPQAADEGE